jgi:hypothetical protein
MEGVTSASSCYIHDAPRRTEIPCRHIKIMKNKMKTPTLLKFQMRTRSFLLATLLTSLGVFAGWGATQAEDKIKGEEMLRRAKVDLAEASHLSETAAQSAQTAQQEQESANQKRLQAHSLEREAFLLIRDSNRMAAAEMRATAEGDDLQVRNQTAELLYLQGLLASQNKIAADTTGAAAKMRDAARDESAPEEKAELGKMADSLSAQVVEATGQASVLEKRMAPVQAEIMRLNAAITQLNESARQLSPVEK